MSRKRQARNEDFARYAKGMSSVQASGTVPMHVPGLTTAVSPIESVGPGQDAETNLDVIVQRAFAQLEGWHLGIAVQCLEIPHGAFGSLCIAISYFETLWQLRTGKSSSSNGERAFREGMVNVFPELATATTIPILTAFAKTLWHNLRNALYHCSLARSTLRIGVFEWMVLHLRHGTPVLAITRDGNVIVGADDIQARFPDAQQYSWTTQPFVALDPHTLVPWLHAHLLRFKETIERAPVSQRQQFVEAYNRLIYSVLYD